MSAAESVAAPVAPTVVPPSLLTRVVHLLLELRAAHDGKLYSTEHGLYARLVAAARELPAQPRVAAQREVFRDLARGEGYDLAAVEDGVVLRLFERGPGVVQRDAAATLSFAQAMQLRADLGAVLLAAVETKEASRG